MSTPYKDDAEAKMKKSLSSLKEEYNLIRGGKASAAIFDKIQVEHYGATTPLNQVASISVPEARVIVIQPWDKTALQAIEKAILSSDLSLNPNNDGKVIRINVPPLTEERRKDLVKQAKTLTEKHRVSVRNIRRDILEAAKKDNLPEDAEKKLKEEIQKLTDNYTKLIDEALSLKEKEILEI
ncbi:MAG: ribosome recycling factor [Spirochaetaceae bacterium]|nr:ribosome recycling factor [Spirochaetaceae bacterium]